MLKPVFQQPHFRVCCLGSFRLLEAGSGTDMTPPSRKARALIGYLSIVGRPVGRERLASLLWADRGDEQARASLRQSIYELRSMLAGNRLLKMERDTVAIGDDVGTDMAVILAAAQSGDLQRLSDALSEWRGDFFEDMPSIDESFDAWLQSERPRIQENLIVAAATAAKAGMERGEIDSARRIVGQLQQRDATNEIALRLGLELDHLAGDTAALRRRYERFCELLKSELDAAPAAETQRLFQELISRSSAAPQPITFGGKGNIAEAEREAIQGSKNRTRIPVWPPGRADHRMKLAAAALALAILGSLAWVLLGLSHKAATSSAGLPELATASSTVTPERLLLAIDTQSEQTADGLAATENGARAAAQRALARDPNNAEALGALAILTPLPRLSEIDRLFERALRAEPNNALLLNWHGRFLLIVGRNHDALKELTRAYVRDHGTPSIKSNLVFALLLTGRFEEAKDIMDIDRDKNLGDEFFSLRVKYFVYRRDWFGLENYLRAAPENLSGPRAAFVRLCRETALAFVARETDRFGPLRAGWRSETSVDPDDAVQILSALGDRDGTFAVIQSVAITRQNDDLVRDPGWETLFGPGLISLRRDPRVAALFAQWGLVDYWRAIGHAPDFMR